MTDNTEAPTPVSAADDVYWDFAETGHRSTDAAIAQMAEEQFESDHPLYRAIASGLDPFLRGLTNAELHAAAGFVAGIASCIREHLFNSTKTTTEGAAK